MPDRHPKERLVERALERLSGLEKECLLCPRSCGVDRTREAKGICRTGNTALVSHALLHYGEEPVLSGASFSPAEGERGSARKRGSGTIFFSGCNLKCVYCQNYQISWKQEGRETSDAQLARMMIALQTKGALNINVVSPTHVILPILRSLRKALKQGLRIPIVYNTNGYDSLEVIQALEGIVDIYLPDLKYRSSLISDKFSQAPDYFERASEAVREMSLQQPVLVVGEDGAARKGLILRHLVLPGCVEDSLSVIRWARNHLSPFIGLSLMSQYRPCFRAPAEINRSLDGEEYRVVKEELLGLGFEHVFIQPEPFRTEEHLVPDFRKKEPFRWRETES